ncbi:MAG TPA: hypothetical protein VF584_14935 [Longimicrobium sp.]
MIRIDRPPAVPRVLATRGTQKRDAIVGAYDAAPDEYDARRQKFDFDGALYGHSTVKRALVIAQHAKCCFCESKTGMDGDVEHYRPKAGFSQGKGQRIEGPGYYWLAYEWSNLLLCCSICNQRFKRSLFPLADASKRARSHRDDVAREEPLFINPAEQDPEEHISFRYEIPFPVGGSRAGKATIEALGLDREILNERRRDRLKQLQILAELVEMEPTASAELIILVEKAKTLLEECTGDAAEFAGMARAAARAGYYLR